MLATMATKKTGKKPAAKGPRNKSKLTLAAEAVQRGMLLKALKDHDWNLSRVSDELGLGHPSAVLRSIKQLDLADEYEAAKAEGKAKPGRPAET